MRNAVPAAFALLSLCLIDARADQNLLPNGDFSVANKLTGWTAAGYKSVEFSTSDADGNPSSGSMVVNSDPTFPGGGLEQATSACFGVVPGAAYAYGGQMREDNGGETLDPHGEFRCSTYASSSCQGVGTPLPTLFIGIDQVNFYPQSTNGVLPANARSANCLASSFTTFLLGGGLRLDASATFDDLYFDLVAPVRVDGYMSGYWYDPAQSGQGFSLAITGQQNTILATWFSFAPDGSGPTWIYAQGPYDPTLSYVTVPAEILDGTRFPPNFNSGAVKHTLWGSITFAFSDCTHGTASWDSTVPGYGSGSMPIVHLAGIAGTTCPQ